MTLRQLLPPLAGVGVVTLALAGGWWATGDDEPAPVRVSERASAPAPDRPRPPKKARPAHAPRSEPAAPPKATGPLGDLAPEERKELRDLVREEQWAETETRLLAYAERADWDDGTTEAVRAILEETTTEVSSRLRDADAGRITWEALRPELRDFRLAQMLRIREILGEEAFVAFAEGMDFWRFDGGGRPGR